MVVPATSIVYVKNEENGKYDTNESNGRLDLWLQIRLKSGCVQEFESFILPNFRIKFSLDKE